MVIVRKLDLEAVLRQMGSAEILSRTFTGVRIVDPVSKRVLAASHERVDGNYCYEFFDRTEPCINCIGSSACSTQTTHKKIEWREHQAYFMTACPVEQQESQHSAYEWVVSLDQERRETAKDGFLCEFFAEDLNTMAVTDMMTGVYNRNYIMQHLPYIINSHSNKKKSMALMIMDLDGFKSINDQYGHLAGDEVLRQMAAILIRFVRRDQDFVARYGGEEFVVFLSNSDLEVATEVAERMRREIEETVFCFNHHLIRLTASFGMVSLIPGEPVDANFLLDVADRALYIAKTDGKNRVEIGVYEGA